MNFILIINIKLFLNIYKLKFIDEMQALITRTYYSLSKACHTYIINMHAIHISININIYLLRIYTHNCVVKIMKI
jgi:hypothetical protein